MLDTRRQIQKLEPQGFDFSLKGAIFKFVASFVLALGIAFIPDYHSLPEQAVTMLFILIFAALLWMSEAIPAFAVSLLIIALEIILLGLFDARTEWEYFLKPWSSPLIFLFLAGFIMAAAASKTKLDIWFAKRVMLFSGSKPENILTGIIAITFTFSMFVSNTATTAMMMSVLVPILSNMDRNNRFGIALLLAVSVSANIGGMGTIIGTPPNAIAVGILGDKAPTFLGWMMLALPPAVLIMVCARWILLKLYPSSESTLNVKSAEEKINDDEVPSQHLTLVPNWKKGVVIATFVITILLWLSGPLHGVPTTVVSFLPIIVFTVVGIVDIEDINSLNWDVIILIIGGLSLGLAVAHTGLADWFASVFSGDNVPLLLIILLFSYIMVIISNFMSNTAATNIILPIAFALMLLEMPNQLILGVVTLALSASMAMALPVSTPPNAIVYSSGRLGSGDFIKMGVIAGLLGPLIVMGWLYLINTLFY